MVETTHKLVLYRVDNVVSTTDKKVISVESIYVLQTAVSTYSYKRVVPATRPLFLDIEKYSNTQQT